jgi:MFS family permease
MTSVPYRSILILSAIFTLRMLGLFMVLPILALYAQKLPHSTPFLIGLALGAYGLSQALLQIPFGLLSDFFGRKPLIVFGLILFIFGSLIAASGHSFTLLILGRILQGSAAIGSVLIALATDLTPSEHHSKAMAIIGVGIGASFFIAMLVGPLIYSYWSIDGIFYLTAILAFLCLVFLVPKLPTPTTPPDNKNHTLIPQKFKDITTSPDLLRCNFGIFALHAILTACFVTMPVNLQQLGLDSNQQWKVYLPIMLATFAIVFPLISIAEKKKITKPVFLSAIIVLMVAFIMLIPPQQHLLHLTVSLWIVLTAFSILEANLPAFVARFAPTASKGTAMGVYSTSQFFGIFFGGISGGWLYGHFNTIGISSFCIVLCLIWFLFALKMSNPNKKCSIVA